MRKLYQKESVNVNALSAEMELSRETIRRYLNELELQGVAKRTHGGAVLVNQINNQQMYHNRTHDNFEEKMKIGKMAARLVKDGDTIFLDASTTCLCMAKHLMDKKITIITNSIQILFEMMNCQGITIISTGGIVVGGVDLLDAYARMEEIEYCAETIMKAYSMGYRGDGAREEYISDDAIWDAIRAMPELEPAPCSPEECDARRLVAKLGRRLYQQKMCLARTGSFSIRVDRDNFIISQHGVDRRQMQPEDTVLISGNAREKGKLPDNTVLLHQRIFADHPEINYIIMADAQHNLAYEMAGKKMRCEVVPEGYLLIRRLASMACGVWRSDPGAVSAALNRDNPAVLFRNDCLLVTGQNWFDSYDRVEVADYNARSMGMAEYIGEMQALSEQEIYEFSKHTGIL